MAQSNLHENLSREDEIVGSSDRAFGLTVGAVCVLIGTIRLALGHDYVLWWLGGGFLLLVLALCWPRSLAPLNRLWLRLGLLLYRVINPLVMALLFYSTIVPIGLMLRAFGKDPLRLRRDSSAATYWLARQPPGPLPESMKNQF